MHVLFDIDDVGARLDLELPRARGVDGAQAAVAEQHDERDDNEARAERRDRRADRDRHRLPRAAQHPHRRAGRRRRCVRVCGAYEVARTRERQRECAPTFYNSTQCEQTRRDSATNTLPALI